MINGEPHEGAIAIDQDDIVVAAKFELISGLDECLLTFCAAVLENTVGKIGARLDIAEKGHGQDQADGRDQGAKETDPDRFVGDLH
jgi:hypothetical protein